jgi:hypothetical protein
MQNQKSAEHIAGWREIMTRTTPAAAATALVVGLLAKSDCANHSRIQRGGFGATMSAASTVAFSTAL